MHHAQVRVRGKQVEEMHGQDIRNSEELKSQKQEQCQQSMDQTLNVKMMDDNNEIFKHDIVVEGADLSSSTRYESDKASPNNTILTRTPLESSNKRRFLRIRRR